MGKTIKQIADAAGVSKTAVRKYLTPEFREKYVETTANGTLLVSDIGANQLLESLRKPVETTENKQETNENQLPETPETEFPPDKEAWYKQQLAEKDEQIRTLHRLLDQQQQLTLAAEQAKLPFTQKLKLLFSPKQKGEQ